MPTAAQAATIALVERFYTAFQGRDAETMAACYADDVAFTDPAFVGLRGERARGMWRMLVARGQDLSLTFSNVTASEDGATATAHWEARYTFSKTGRRVHNVIDARFRVRGGRIVEHVDHFDFWRWSRQALGAPGLLLGWTPILRGAVQKQAAAQLEAYLTKRG